MTLEQYFNQEQPISDKTISDTCLYEDVVTIEFGEDNLAYGAIKIAHVGESLWALGYEIKPNATSKVICKDCTTNDITMGCINNLVYGMTTVLASHLRGSYTNNKLRKIISKGVKEASLYYDNNAKSMGKITI